MASLPEPALAARIPRAAPPDQGSFVALLQFEAELRRCASVPELVYHLANETRRILGYDQMFVLRQARLGDGFHVAAVSSVATVDRNAPLIQAVEATVAALARTTGLNAAHDFDAGALHADPAIDDYPFRAWRWQPLAGTDGDAFAGVLIAREVPLLPAEAARLERVAETGAHAWRALAGGTPVQRIRIPDRRERRGFALLLAAIALVPVPMTALAPAEVVAQRPFVVAAPFQGTVDRILIPPNTHVRAGQPILTFDDTKLRNEQQQAAEKLEVARARVERATNTAFAPSDETRDITTTRAERDVAQADYDYARDMLARSRVVAPRSGVALYSDRRDWEGRAVNTGDPVLQIVDPRAVELRIDLPTKQQMELAPGDRIEAWLDAQPLWALDGRIDAVSYQARQTPAGVLAFTITARLLGAVPRIGSRGTARVYGRWAPLSYVLLRRPIASARQYLGL